MTISVRGGPAEAQVERVTVARVAALATAPVKGLRLQSRDELRLSRIGACDDRRFFLVDDGNRMVNGRRIRSLTAVVADYDPDRRWLTMTFPDGQVVDGAVQLGEAINPGFFARTLATELVIGPWSDALSDFTHRNVRLVMVADGVPGTDRGPGATVTLMSRASVQRLEDEAGHAVDPRRFRMQIQVDGIEAHAEDAWVGQRLQVGGATIQFNGHVGRCIVTGLDPDTGRGDMPTLELLRQYRLGLDTTESLTLGVYGGVVVPGVVRLGDPVLLLE
jgi:uncharacterized protein YcbX